MTPQGSVASNVRVGTYRQTDRHFSNESRSLESQYEELLKKCLGTSGWTTVEVRCASQHEKKKKKKKRTSTWPPIDKVAQEILLSVCKAELKEVNGHEHEQHQASDGQTQLTTHQSRRQLLISSPLQTLNDMQ